MLLGPSTWSYSRCRTTSRRFKRTTSWSSRCLRTSITTHSRCQACLCNRVKSRWRQLLLWMQPAMLIMHSLIRITGLKTRLLLLSIVMVYSRRTITPIRQFTRKTTLFTTESVQTALSSFVQQLRPRMGRRRWCHTMAWAGSTIFQLTLSAAPI